MKMSSTEVDAELLLFLSSSDVQQMNPVVADTGRDRTFPDISTESPCTPPEQMIEKDKESSSRWTDEDILLYKVNLCDHGFFISNLERRDVSSESSGR